MILALMANLSKHDSQHIGLPILKKSNKQVGVANGGKNNAKYVTCLQYPQLSPKATQDNTFYNFPTSLLNKVQNRRQQNHLPCQSCYPDRTMWLAKILFNSISSTPGAKYMTMDISNFYLMTLLLQPGYIQIYLTDLPNKIINEYKLKDKVTPKCFIFLKVTKDMKRLQLLENQLNKHGYFQSKIISGLWKHTTRPIQSGVPESWKSVQGG